jgi:hypothetical protein
MNKDEAEYMSIGVGEPRLYVSQYWVVDDATRPMLRIVAGPFNDEQETHWETENRSGLAVIETRQPVYQSGEE